jgi:homoserine dehydrogenase
MLVGSGWYRGKSENRNPQLCKAAISDRAGAPPRSGDAAIRQIMGHLPIAIPPLRGTRAGAITDRGFTVTRFLASPPRHLYIPPVMANKSVGIALLGCGIVGGGVAAILRDQRELLRQRTGISFDLRHVIVRDPKKTDRLAGLPIGTDAMAAISDPKVDIVCELIGGTGVAAEYFQSALKAGKPVVTANKSLLATRGPELFALARKHSTCIAFEASCGGGIPIINALTHGLVANRIDAMVGIVNGTCNFILTQMTRNGWTYPQALAEAQKLGFAEADPTLDVSGRDAAQKLAVLAGLAFNATIEEADIHIEGIDKLADQDFKLANELGYVIKLLAIAERVDGARLVLRVHPTLVHQTDVLAEVSGSFNAVSVYGNAVGHALFYGRGAGRMPTASSVVSDIVNVALGTTQLAFKQLNIFPDTSPKVQVRPISELNSRYYLRLVAKDQPGVLAQITRILSDQKISLSAIMQHEVNSGQFVPIVITTHLAREGSVQKAIAEINSSTAMSGPAVCLRIIDQPREFAGL